MEASPWGSGADVILAAVLREFLRLLVHPHRDLPHVLPELIEQNAIQPSPTTTAGGRQSQKLVLHRPYGKPVKFDAPQLHQILTRGYGARRDPAFRFNGPLVPRGRESTVFPQTLWHCASIRARTLMQERRLDDNLPKIEEAVGFGPHAQEIMGDVPNDTDLSPVIQISEVVVGQ